jgi:biopolymer transport protein TolR
MAINLSSGAAIKAEPNVTPMIDVMLVLLIIFMIVVPAINAGFQAVPPEGTNVTAHPEEEEDQVLGIDADGQYYLNKRPIRNDDLEAQLKSIYETREVDRILYVKAHRDLEYIKVLDAVDIAAKSGVRVAGMITDQRPGTKSSVAGDDDALKVGTPGGKQ